MRNPWTQLSACDVAKLACGDELLLKAYVDKCKKDCSLNLWPEPYLGSPKAPVYLLNGNPGYSNLDHLFTEDPEYVKLVQRSLQHKGLYPLNDFLYFNVIHTRGIVHGGSLWWEEKTRGVRAELCGNYPYMFNVEFFPYHSKNRPSIPAAFPQSSAYIYTNELLLAAIKQNKLFVIMRMQKEWIYRLQSIARQNSCTLDLNNILVLNSSSNVAITKDNVSYYDKAATHHPQLSAWDKLIMVLRKHCSGCRHSDPCAHIGHSASDTCQPTVW